MGTKAKIYLSIASIFMIAVIAAVSLAAVFAVGKQTFSSAVNVSYTAVQVHGSAKANVIFGGSVLPMQNDAGDEEIYFRTTADSETQSLRPTETTITLTDEAEQNFVVFEYIFKNDETKPYSATLTYQDTGDEDQGIDVFVLASHSMISASYQESVTTPVKDMTGTIVTDSVDGELYVYVLFQLQQGASEAGFSGKFMWNLSGV